MTKKLVPLKMPGITGGGAKPLPLLKKRPILPTMAPVPDPIDPKGYPGDPEGDCDYELDEVQKGFRERMKAERERHADATGGAYYFVAVFASESQCSAFIQAAGLDKGGDLFIDGRNLADRMGIDLPAAESKFNTSQKVDRKLQTLVAPELRKAGAKG